MPMTPPWFSLLSRRLGLPEPTVTSVERQRDLRTVTGDGVELLADRWAPSGPGVTAPLLLVRTPYGRRGLLGLLYGRYFAHQGFQVVIQSCRGSGGSGGSFDTPFDIERDDGAATVKWLLDQPWYPGSFATIGGSYFGYTQLALAEAATGHLAAAVLQITPTSVHDVAWTSGAFALDTALGWTSGVRQGPDKALRALLTRRRRERRVLDAGLHPPLLTSYQRATAGCVGYFEGWLTHPDPADDYWNRLDQSDALDAMSCPVLVQAGWYDLFLEAGLEQYQRLASRGTPVELTVGPWTHASFSTKGLGHNWAEATAFLRRATGGSSEQHATPVRLLEITSNDNVHLPAWPPPDQSRREWYLAGDGRLTSTTPTGKPAATGYEYNPLDPTPAVGGPTLDTKAGPRDNAALEARRDVVTFTTEPLTEALHVLGSPAVAAWIESNRPATAVLLRLCLVNEGGTSTNVIERLVQLPEAEQVEDGIWHVQTTLPPTALLVPAGSRVRLQISSGSYPAYMRHPGTSDDIATATTFDVARQLIHHSAARASTLSLPLGSG